MTEQQLEVRRNRAEQDVLIITTAPEGWRVRSARNPSRFYLVSANGSGLQCTCPDFQNHTGDDSKWQCKHMLAVQQHRPSNGAADPQPEREQAEERAAIQAKSPAQTPPKNGEIQPAQMLIKRSISPDGRIDSISIEFAFVLDDAAPIQIKERAVRTLK